MTDEPQASDAFDEDALLRYTRGEAGDREAREIETRAAGDALFAAEIALMRGLKPALAKAGPAPGEFGWRRLEAEIGREARQPANLTRAPSRLWRVAAIVCGLAVLGQTGYILRGSGPEATYQTASGDVAGPVLAVGFAPETPEAELRALLLSLGAELVGGPSSLGLYRLGFADDAAREAARAALETAPVVTLVAEE